MKKLLIILILASISCKSGTGSTKDVLSKEVLVRYSKSACLGRCPVYSLLVFTDGTAIYNGIDKVKQKGKITFILSSEEDKRINAIIG